ncbi:MAG: sulfite exporter TauE/SafE family protein [Bacteroidia bacterium]|nr:sulfite exporter TauE/SafE family protein [Bacteroidia bacterium]
MNTVYALLIIGLAAGYLSGLIGIGGGVIIVPALVYLLSMNQKTAQGSTLFMFLFPVGLLGVYNYHKAGHIDYRTAAIMAITFVVGSYLGSKTAIAFDTKVVKQVFAVVIILIGVKMLWDK